MNELLGDLVDVCAFFYLDDVLFFLILKKYVYMVFYRLAQFKYNVKCKKCKPFSKKVEFLGHTVSAANIVVV